MIAIDLNTKKRFHIQDIFFEYLYTTCRLQYQRQRNKQPSSLCVQKQLNKLLLKNKTSLQKKMLNK